MQRIAPLIILALLSACSSQEMYEAIQRDQRQQCQTLPETEFERCMARTAQSFEDYSREREEALSRPPQSP